MHLITARDAVELECEFFGSESNPLLVLVAGAGAPAAASSGWKARVIFSSKRVPGTKSAMVWMNT